MFDNFNIFVNRKQIGRCTEQNTLSDLTKKGMNNNRTSLKM